VEKPNSYQLSLVKRMIELGHADDLVGLRAQVESGLAIKVSEDYEDNYGSFEIYPNDTTPKIKRESVILTCIGHEKQNPKAYVSLLLHAYDGVLSELEIIRDDMGSPWRTSLI